MGGLHMFHDLPRIHLQDAEYRSNNAHSGDFDHYWPTLDPQDMATGITASRELDIPTQPRHPRVSVPRYSPQNPAGLFHSSWTTDFPRSHESLRSHPMPSSCEGLNPVPYNLAIPRDTSPDGWWNGNRAAIEQDSSSGGGTWSPRTSEGRPEMEIGSSRRITSWGDLQALSNNSFYGYPTSFSQSSSYESPRSSSGIALCEIQQYPDIEPDELSMKPLQDMKIMEPPYSFDYQNVESVQYTQDDEGIGSSIQEEEEDMAMEDDVHEDDVSDYTPTEGKRSHRHNSSRSAAVLSHVATNSPIQKRPSRPRNSSSVSLKRNSKVTKRAHIKPLAPTPSPTSPLTSSKSSKTACPQCSSTFPSISALNKHTLAIHTRPFVCSFRLYGCSSTFGSKNEWKRHVSSQHLRLGIYRCDIGSCVPQTKTNQHHRKSSSTSGTYLDTLKAAAAMPPARDSIDAKEALGHNDFNRKDLFTQHVRRMHGPPSSAPSAEREHFDANLETIRSRCWIPLRNPPPRSRCGFCYGSDTPNTDKSNGKGVFDSWDERMEHVGKHLEKGMDAEKESEDLILREWMLTEGLISKDGTDWKVVGCGTRRRGKGAVGDDEEDGEGEED